MSNDLEHEELDINVESDEALFPAVVGPLFWFAMHRVIQPEEFVALARIFPCCNCRGNFLLKEALIHKYSRPVTYEDAIVLWTDLLNTEYGGNIVAITYALHARVNEALGRSTTWPSLKVVQNRISLSPLTHDVIFNILTTATASLCKSSNNFDDRAREYCQSTSAPLDLLCQSQALIYSDRVFYLKKYIMLWKARDVIVNVQVGDPWYSVSRVVNDVNLDLECDAFVKDLSRVIQANSAGYSNVLLSFLRTKCGGEV